MPSTRAFLLTTNNRRPMISEDIFIDICQGQLNLPVLSKTVPGTFNSPSQTQKSG